MKMSHHRRFAGRRFTSATHYGYRDPLADKLAAAIRRELGCRVRVVQDEGSGLRHVFVEDAFLERAQEIAFRPDYA